MGRRRAGVRIDEEQRMADKRKARGAGISAQRAREAPTIDLTATEIPTDPVQTDAETAAAAAAPESEPPPQVTPDPPPAEHIAEPSAPADADAPRDEVQGPPPPEPPAADEPAVSDQPPGPEAPPPDEKERRPGIGLPLAAGFVGGLVPAAILAGAWYGGVLPVTRSPDLGPRIAQIGQQVATVQSDLSALQAQTKALAVRANTAPARPGVDPAAVDALTQRVAKLETEIKNFPAPAAAGPADSDLEKRIAALETMEKTNEGVFAAIKNQVQQATAASAQARHQVDAVGATLSQLGARVDELARQQPAGVSPAQFEDLQKQVAALEQTTQAAQKQIARNASANSAARTALATATLRNAVLSHAPYEAELTQAKALGADQKQLSALQRYAASGVPTDAALAAELRKLIPQLTDVAAPQPSGSFLDRLRANAGALVRITPADAPAGDDPADVLARLTVEAGHADIAGALRDIGKLPAQAQQKAAPWVAAVHARDAALSAARTLATESARALGPG
jgi:hypothetical protein